MNKSLTILLLLVTACCSDIKICSKTSNLNVLSSSLWEQTDIKVCWEADTKVTLTLAQLEEIAEAVKDEQ